MTDDPRAPRRPVRLADYRPFPWRITGLALEIELDFAVTRVHARFRAERRPERPREPLRLDGEGLETRALQLDGAEPAPGAVRVVPGGLLIDPVGDAVEIASTVHVRPEANTALEGLYRSGAFLLTQCEAEGFRRITWFPDRPDVMTVYDVTLVAAREAFPVLLANGNPAGAGTRPDGRHWARWIDPHPKPCYLFALVAGRLERIARELVTAEGRRVTLAVWAEADAIGRCGHALDCLERALRWDEEAYGRCYDLDVFNLVATHDFNMGAMENKGLNIFNAKYVVADVATATDADFAAVESVVGHEYFHNWTGNRVTCRDWFQLALKEGLTVFRDRQFSGAMGSPALKRIEDVRALRSQQFPEDAGPFAHPVRPDSYLEINNFYTATVYEKGAEVVRLLHATLGPEGFRRGMDHYFARHDGAAVTIEDFLAALGEANDRDLSAFLAWYTQAGTPQLRVSERHDPARGTYTLELAQATAPTPGQPEKRPLPIPVTLMLYRPDGEPLPLALEDGADGAPERRTLLLERPLQRWTFTGIAERPVLSVLQDFSAPVLVHPAQGATDTAFLARHDRDPFNRWNALQTLGERAVLAQLAQPGEPARESAFVALVDALAALLDARDGDPAFAAECLALPDEIWLAERAEPNDPARLHAARERVRAALGEALATRLLALHEGGAGDDPLARDGGARGRRRLRNVALGLLLAADPVHHAARAEAQYRAAGNMTDRLAALTALVHAGVAGAQPLAEAFYREHRDDPLVVDKWLVLQATNPQPGTLERVQRLTQHPAFAWRNPNKVRSLVMAFARNNRAGFHVVDGAGYRFVAQAVTTLDALNPQVAARLAGIFNGWRRLEPLRRELMRAELERLAATPGLSPDSSEIVQRALA